MYFALSVLCPPIQPLLPSDQTVFGIIAFTGITQMLHPLHPAKTRHPIYLFYFQHACNVNSTTKIMRLPIDL